VRNLARQIDRNHLHVDPEVQDAVRAELAEAGCEVMENDILLESCGEVPTSLGGIQCRWSFRRAWRYWVAKGPGIPPDTAEAFHQTWGQEVRVDGHCGCPSPLEMFEGFAVGHYHIDTQAGLNAFVALLKSLHKPKQDG
jgi:hypothetical protein